MSRLTHAQKLAFAREIAEKDEADQQQVLAASRQATITANTSMDKVYNNASASVDVIAGLIGKKTLLPMN